MELILPAPKKWTQLFGILLLLVFLFSLTIFAGNALLSFYKVKELNATVFFSSRILFWLPLLFIFIYARKAEGQKLLIWEEKKLLFWEYLVSAIAIFFALFIGLLIIIAVLLQFGLERESSKFLKMLVIFRENPLLIFLTAATAGIVEELTFRGYMLPRMVNLFKSPALGIIFSSLLFGLLHFSYGTVIQVVGPFFIGFIFALYYYKFRNIKILIICHFLWDVMAIYLQLLAQDIKTLEKL
ncbi:MAG: CPBP family intramembrane glutamic endopeptidase [Bacteroidia bacterium]